MGYINKSEREMSKFVQTAGKIRRSQVIFSFGVGAIIDLPKGSYMPLGLEQQDFYYNSLPKEIRTSLTIHEPRLQKLLGVEYFRSATVPGDRQISQYGDFVEKNYTLPCIRFPRWLECPTCHRIGIINNPFEKQPDLSVKCIGCNKHVNPVRFIVVCVNGHIDDFPWIKWAHSLDEENCTNPRLFLKSKGRSAALGDLYVECQTCNQRRSLGDIYKPHALKMIKCFGKRPWLLENGEECSGQLLTQQRGGSSVYFPVVASALSIPPASEAISSVLEEHWIILKYLEGDQLKSTLEGLFKEKKIVFELDYAIDWIYRRKIIDMEDNNDESTAKFAEYEALRMPLDNGIGIQTAEFEKRNISIDDDIKPWIKTISAVTKLREVRALCGFTRIKPRQVAIEKIQEMLQNGCICALSKDQVRWRPGVEIRGEGIFLQLNEKKLNDWSNQNGVKKRADSINTIFQGINISNSIEMQYSITPKLLLVHSLAHLIIRRVSMDCGYASASLRERLYISEEIQEVGSMAGILIYTASTDSDGSLGGLVNMATKEKVRNLIINSIKDANWCGNDPVCLETNPRIVGERFSGASCHSCLLLPETSCEKFNKELDRAMISGYSEENIVGFFDGFPEV